MKQHLPLLLLSIVLFFFSQNNLAQFNGCDPNVPNTVIDLSQAAYNGAAYNPATINTGVGYQCCSINTSYSCETFSIITNPNAGAMMVKVDENGANVVIKQGNCNTTITNSQYFCIAGGATIEISICSDGGAPLNVQFETIGAPTVSPPISATIGCTKPLQILGYTENTISLNSTSPGSFGDYNGQLNCNTGCTGQVQFTPINGNPNSITYQICGSSLAPTCFLNGANYCQNFTININAPMSVSGLNNQTVPICIGNPIPDITATVTGGAQPYSYFWNGPGIDPNLYTSSSTISNLSAGTYTLEVIDNSGCSAGILSTTYNLIPSPTVNAGQDLNFCTPVNNLLIQGSTTPQTNLTWSGGLGSFSSLNSPATMYSPSQNELTSGSITLTLTGTNACGNSQDNVIVNFYTTAGITLNSAVTDILCFGTNTGAIDITVSNGSGNYTYLWNTGASSQDLTNIPAGIYSVQVTDVDFGCTNTIGATVNNLSVGPLFTVSSNKVNPTCFGSTNGSISSSISGGTGPYTYLWANGNGSNPNITNVSAGNYQLTVTDANGCTTSLTETLTSPQDITITGVVTNIDCNGNQNGAIDLSVTGGTGPLLTNWMPGNISTQDISGLTNGIYTVTITDQNGCIKNASYTINEPTLLAGNANISNATCFGSTNGSIDFTPSGGTPNYTYSWSNGSNTQDLNGLGSGIYVVTLVDANNCSAQFPFVISQPSQIDLSISSTNVTCNGLSNGTASVTASGGDGNYTYAWSIINQTTSTVTNLGANTYSITVTDGTGCSKTSSVNITQPNAISATFATTHVPCNGFNTGSIDLTISGGTGPFSQVWSNAATTEDISGLSAGNYSVTITDALGCTGTFSTTITEPTAIQLSTSVTNVVCFGNSTGGINLSVSGGIAPYTYAWNNGSVNEDLSGIVAGTYVVVVSDANNCNNQISSTVNQPASGMTGSSAVTNVSCNGAATGGINISVNGGTTPYTFLWNDNTSLEDLSNYPAGNYSVTVTDNNNCPLQLNAVITEPTPITISSTNTDILCNGAATGAIDLLVSGGISGYTYSWSNNATTEDLLNVGFGNYAVTVLDNNGCAASYNTTLTQPGQLTLTKIATNATCFGTNTGAVNITVNGGIPNYTFSWSNNTTNEDLSNVPAGNYSVVVTDANGCSASTSATVNQPTALVLNTSSTPATCNPDGSASVSVSGGTSPYQYAWSNNATTSSITNLAAGTYTVTVTDANGCTANSSVNVAQQSGLTASATVTSPILCNGGAATVNVSASGGTGPYTNTGQYSVTAGSYSYTVTDANGCSVNANVVVSEPVLLTGSFQVTNAIPCNGGIGDIDLIGSGGTGAYTGTGPVSGLTAGSYSYNIADANGCSAVINVTLTQPNALSLSTLVSDAICNGASTGNVNLSVSGGTLAYAFQWNDGSSNEDLSNVPAGNYSVVVTDANGCSASTSATVNQPTALVLNTSSTPATCNPDGSASVSVSGGTSPYQYAWSNNATTSSITNLAAGTYTVTVTDANGCTANSSVNVAQQSGLTASATVTSPILCNGGAATVNVSASGGTGPYTNTGQYSVTAGSYSYTVTDANGCSVNANVVVSEPVLLTGSFQVTNAIPCNGGIGDIDLIGSGGTGAYTGTGPVSGLTAGSYSYNIADANGCSAVINVTLTQPNALSLSTLVSDAICNGASTGNVNLSVSGGTLAYAFQWNDGSSNEDLSNVPAGNYSVVVTDANGCSASTSATVNQPTALVLNTSSTPATCNPDGSASVSVSGGTSPYQYAWSNNATTSSITNLAAGTYTVTVTDANGCTANSSVNVAQQSGLTASATVTSPILCNGGAATVNVSASGGTGPYTNTGQYSVTAGSYSYTVTDANGCSVNANVVVSEPVLLTGSFQVTNAIPCNGGIGDIDLIGSGGTGAYTGTGPVSGLTAGSYSYNIADANGCSAVINVTLTQPNALSLSTLVSDAICNGASTGNVNLSVSGGTLAYAFQWNDGSSNEDLSNVPAGNYSVVVTDANGCSASTSATVNQPTALVLNTSSTPATCNPDGSASVSVSGGTSPYQYAWSNNATTSSITNLAAGTYTVTVTDANGCTANSSVNVAQQSGLTASATVTSPILCNGGAATVNVSASGGTGPYTNTGQYSVTAGSYSYTVTDANGCSVNANVVVSEPAPLAVTLITNNVSCNGANNGSIQANVTGGIAGYTYSWSIIGSSSSLLNLSPNTYNLVVTDQNGCTINGSSTITEPALISLNAQVVDVACNGGTNASIDLSVTGGTPSYTYSWSNSSTTEDLSNLSAGNYTVLVTDANGCNATLTSTVNQPTPLNAISSVTTPITVNGGTGVITVTANGGTAGYTGTGSFTVSSGTYTYNVVDANGCTTSTTVNITEPNQLIASAILNTPISCNGGSASITVSATGGQAPYTGTGTFNLTAGTYNLTVTDAFNVSSIATITITEPPVLNGVIQSNNITCNGANNGSASVIASGGTSPYTYLWSNNATSANISNLSPGLYSVTVTDANGCNTSVSISITEPNILQATSSVSTAILCFGGNAVVSVTSSGGTAPYTGIGNNTVSAGTYTYNVTDANGCTATTSITVNEPASLSASANSTNLSCNGSNNGTATVTANGGTLPYSYLWSNSATTAGISTLSPGPYSVTVTDANGCTAQSSVNITQPAILNASSTITSPILCNGGNATISVSGTGGTSPYSGTGSYAVASGTYNYTVTDANGCIAQTAIVVNQPTLLQASAVVSQSILCHGGTGQISVNATGGTGPYTGTGLQTVLAGNYTYNVTDANGCAANASVSISEPATLTVSVTGINPLCNGNSNGSAQANVSGGTAPYVYSWSNGGNSNIIQNLAAGLYTIQVTDANGCSVSGSITLSQPGNLNANAIISSPILCNGGSGQVNISAAGGTTPYTGVGTFSAFAGVNSYTVTDANGCTASTSINVAQPSPLVANAAVASPIACFGGNGNIIVTAIGGTPSYVGTGTFNVASGNYTYTVSDANGCSTTTAISVSQPPALVGSATIVNAVLCNGGSATIQVGAVGGTPSYNGTGTFSAFAGTQNYVISDANGCSTTANVTIPQPSQVSSLITSQQVTCNGLNNGSASVLANGGTPNYTYLWNNNATTASITNLSPGAYSVTVTDANGCQSVSNVIITQPTQLTSSVVQTANIACFGGSGTVFVSGNGGTAPYVGTGSQVVVAGNPSFTITDANGCTSVSSLLITQPTQLVAIATQTSPIICFGGQATVALTGTGGTGAYTGTGSVLSLAGNNLYTIQDANGCSASTTLLITQPTAVTATFNNTTVTCFGLSNGGSIATVTGGTPGYLYLWNTGSQTNTISNQLAGNYSLQVTDANGCQFTLNTTITQPAPIVATANVILPIACFGGQAMVLVNGAGGTPGYNGNGTFYEYAGTHTYVLTDQNGCIDSTTITVTQPPAFTAVATITSPISCNGGQATVVVSANGGVAPFSGTGTFTVSAGTYTYNLIDANGCVATTTINVTQPTPLVLSATIINPILCHGDSALISIGASGGTPAYSGTGNFLVPAGNYSYIVSDINGCNNVIGIQVTQPNLLTSSVATTNISCNGANDGSAIIFYSGGTAPLNILWSNGSTSNSIVGLAPGNYSVTVTDANGCQNVHNITITQPNVLLASAVESVPIACFNGNATVVVSATGGTTPYVGTGTFFPVSGNYIYTVMDAQGCTDTASITINQPTQLSAVANIISPIACFGGQATINISATGGVAPYVGTGNLNVSAGNQSFTVTDANGCSFVINLFINQPTQLFTSISSQNVSCFNAGNGSATVSPIGGTPGYQYLWSNNDTTISTTNLTPGLYSVVVTDTNGCQTTNQVTITQPSQLIASSSIGSPVFCFGGNATVNISAVGGTQPYSGTGAFTQSAGTQTYYVTDANGCVDSTTITVNQPNQLIASASQSSNVLCFGGNATVAISSIGGTPVISGTGNFTVPAGWNNFTVTDSYGCQDTTSIFISQPTLLVANATLVSPVLCNGGTAVLNISASGGTPGYVGQGNLTVIAGTYTYNVTDTNGCTASTTITVTQPNTLQAVANITSPIVCNAGTGVITVTGVGGTAPYTGTGSFTVAAGTYTYPISDANGCTSSVSITINQPPVLSLSLTQTNVNCNGFATGSITANPAGGQGPYSYLWSNSQITQTVTNLLAGSYSVVVTDNLGCTVSANTTITQPQAPILLQESHVNVLCFGNNTGSINLSVSGGTSPYTYSWSNSATTQDIQNLIAGTYNVSVTDANGCVAVMSINITQPAFPLTVGYTVTNVSCFGYTDGAIDVTPQGGTGPFTYFWTTGQFTQDLNNIPPGQYVVAITDANNCVSSAQITVTQPTAPLSATISQLPVSCYGYNDGQLTANTIGGTAPYSYVWTPTGQTGSIASALAPGNYIVNITDANGCTASATDVLTTPPPFIASFTVSDNIVCLPSTVTFTNSSIGNVSTVLWTFSNGLTYSSNQFNVNFNNVGCVDVTLLITNTNGCTADTTISNAVCVVPGPTAAFTTASPAIDFVTGGIDFINNSQNYSGSIWQFGDGGSSTQDNPSHFYPASTIADYSVMLVVYDVNGCTDTAYNVVQSNDEVRLTVPNAFTPNGDGLNDLFIPIISNSDQVQYYRFEVYNRWGQLVFETNKPGEGWDGKFKGKLSQFGTYNWKVSYDVPEQNSVNANGHVTLVK